MSKTIENFYRLYFSNSVIIDIGTMNINYKYLDTDKNIIIVKFIKQDFQYKFHIAVKEFEQYITK